MEFWSDGVLEYCNCNNIDLIKIGLFYSINPLLHYSIILSAVIFGQVYELILFAALPRWV